MTPFSMFKNRWFVFLHDLLWIPAAIFLAYWLRFNLGDIDSISQSSMQLLIVIALPLQAAACWYFGLYRGVWRFASIPDLMRILKAVLVGAILSVLVMFIWQRLLGVPRSVLVLYPVFLALGLSGSRILYRAFKDYSFALKTKRCERALLIGAGQAGELLVRDLLKSDIYQPVAFLDDDGNRQGREIHGVRVVGRLFDLEQIIVRYEIDIVLLAIPSASHQVIQAVVSRTQGLDIPCRILPSVAEMADGRVEVSRLRKVQIEDLLGRDTVALAQTGVKSFLTGNTVLITGAGGSIGSELCRQVARHQPECLLLLDHSEFSLYTVDHELEPLKETVMLHPVLADMRDTERMRWVFEHFQPSIVFNAAAYKHVPLVEQNPAEGVKTNVLGTCGIADMAVEFGVEKFIQISTDKAVNPTNVMGASKRCAEIYTQNLNLRSDSTAFITTRFGNVLGSTGSVVPLFSRQIEAGGPITVTHPDITRYFMTIPEAVSLILQAGSMGEGGEIFVLDMGDPVKITDLAEQMIRLTGLEPGRDIEIVFTGLRPGEKLYEELFHDSESLVQTMHPKIMLSGSRVVDWDMMQDQLALLRKACVSRDVPLLYAELKQLVPEFVPDSDV